MLIKNQASRSAALLSLASRSCTQADRHTRIRELRDVLAVAVLEDRGDPSWSVINLHWNR